MIKTMMVAVGRPHDAVIQDMINEVEADISGTMDFQKFLTLMVNKVEPSPIVRQPVPKKGWHKHRRAGSDGRWYYGGDVGEEPPEEWWKWRWEAGGMNADGWWRWYAVWTWTPGVDEVPVQDRSVGEWMEWRGPNKDADADLWCWWWNGRQWICSWQRVHESDAWAATD